MARRPTLVVFVGGLGGSPVEEMVAGACRAAALDSIEAALGSGAFAGAVLVTDDPTWTADLASVILHLDDGPFHFGRRLAEVLRRHSLDAVVYLGGGSLPLFTGTDFAAVARTMERDSVLVTNNPFSSDMTAFRANGVALAAIEAVTSDNALARALAEGAGLTVEGLPRTVATQLDIDGPTDLAVLHLTGLGGPRLRSYLQGLDLDLRRYRRTLPLFVDPRAQVVVAGRVGSHAWRYLERETACRVRLFAEERGMQADGRAQDGTARSLLGFFLEAVGIERFFATLTELGDAAFIDTRVLLAHLRLDASRADRFLSDLGRWQEIQEPFLREFTHAAVEAPIPVLLGGHSLVSGGLMALNEFAWQEKERTDNLEPRT